MPDPIPDGAGDMALPRYTRQLPAAGNRSQGNPPVEPRLGKGEGRRQ